MKFKLLLSLLLVLGVYATSYASFPVKRVSSNENQTEVTTTSNVETITPLASTSTSGQNKWIGVALWFFLGGLAAHRWYYKKPVGWNILFIVTLGGLFVWAVIDLINILTDNF